jgi:hypothetical protein
LYYGFEKAYILRRTTQIPVTAPLVTGLVITVAGIVCYPLVPSSTPPINEVGTARYTHNQQYRYATLCD